MEPTWLEELNVRARKAAADNGLELFSLEHRLSGKRWWVRVTLDRPDGAVGIADCEAVSRDLSVLLDVDDVIPHAYELEVSSPGVERPLRGPADYERFRGKQAKIVLAAGGPDAGMSLEGEIGPVTGGVLTLTVDGEPRQVELARVKSAHLLFVFP